MAFDLKAVIRIVDKATEPIKRIQRATQQLQRTTEQARRSNEIWHNTTGKISSSMERFAFETKKANSNLREFGSGLRNVASVGSGVRSLAGQFTALAAAVGGAVAAKKIFDSTIVEAAKFENSQVVIRAMFDDRKAADSYMKMIQRFAIDSPVLNSQDMFDNSKSFIAASKNLSQLEKMWNLAERLVALDPIQGVEGAVLSLKEFFSGDVTSLVERFELPRKELRAIKDLPLNQQLKALDKFLNKIGATNKLVNEMGTTTLGLWNRIKETTAVTLRTMGQPALAKIRVFLDGVVKALDKNGTNNEFVKFGQDMLAGITQGFISAAKGVGRLAKSIIDNPQFKRLKSVKAKVVFVIEDLYKRFMNWFNKDGSKKLEAMTSTLIKALSSAIEKNAVPIAKAALSVGWSIGSALVKGISDAISESPIAKAIVGAGIGAAAGSVIPGVGTAFGAVVGAGTALGKHYLDKVTDGYFGLFSGKKTKGSHYHGLSYVPYDGYTATLHQGERILTAKENREYSHGGGAKSVVITGNTFVVREEADIRKIAGQLADLLAEAGANGA